MEASAGAAPVAAARPVALLGGTFDPVHTGHLQIAQDVRQALGLAAVRLVPAGDPPHRGGTFAGAAHRLAMLELAVRDCPGLVVDAREVRRAGKSYTVLTLEELRAENPGAPLLLVVGADAFHGFPTWHRWHEVFDLAHVVVVTRPGVDPAAELPPALAAHWNARATSDRRRLEASLAGAVYPLAVTPCPVSSTAIRQALAQGPQGAAALDGLLPAPVLAYIARNHLYRFS
jgi:nicotinate-nucleotide adenylyltransferase